MYVRRGFESSLPSPPRSSVGRRTFEKSHRPGTGLVALLAIGILLLGVGVSDASAPARGSSGLRTATSSTLAVTATAPFKFDPSAIQQLPTSTNITVTLTDADTQQHNLTISSRQGVVIPSSDTPAQLASFFSQYPPMFSIQVNPSSQVTGSFLAPAAGWYEFVCLIPGHFAEGMYGFIAFGMNLPSNLTVNSGSSGPGAAVFIISGTIVVLVVVALVLGFVIGRRKGGVYEMPPERLGYPEPGTPPLPPGAPGPHPKQ